MTSLESKNFSTAFGKITYYRFESKAQSTVNLFIHGLGGNRKWFPNDFETYGLEKYSWIVPDLMGHGDSQKNRIAEAYTMEKQAEFILTLLQHEGVDEISILAHSMGGPIAILLIEMLVANKEKKIKVASLLYLEGNLDAGDAITSSFVSSMPIERFKEGFDSWCKGILAESQDLSILEWIDGVREAGPFVIWESSKDCAHQSKWGNLLHKLEVHLDFPVHFIFGENNKGRFSSENAVREAKHPIHFIPNAGHAMFRDNPEYFWKLVESIFEA
jgi:pimeloyl-ACP methyl ester carboxylesterase